MKRALVLCLFLLVNGTCVKAAATFFPPLRPAGEVNPVQDINSSITSAADPFAGNSDLNYSALNRIEQAMFGRVYAGLNITTRLSKIEKSLFNATYPSAPTNQRIDNIISNFNQINKYPNISRNGLSKLENKIFNQDFSQNSAQRRIERLEQQVFGAEQSGNLTTRYENLVVAVKYYNTNPTNNYYPNSVASSGLRGMMNNMGNSMIGGSMTGMTPPMGPSYNGYNDPFSSLNPGGGIYRGYGVNNGLRGYRYQDDFENFGTGTGVKILD